MKLWWSEAHELFRVLLAAVPLAAWAAASADGSPPSAALGSEVLWRLEVAGGALLAGYIPLMALWLAYQGRWLKIPVPTGGAAEPADAVGSAADLIEQANRGINERFGFQDGAIREIADRSPRWRRGLTAHTYNVAIYEQHVRRL